MDRLFTVMERAALMVLCVSYGALIAFLNAWPYDPYVKNAMLGIEALTFNLKLQMGYMSADIWAPEDTTPVKRGVTIAKPGQDDKGLVLLTVGEMAKLLDRQGNVVHEWSIPYSALPSGVGRIEAMHDDMMYWQRARALPNGDLIVLVNHNYYSPDGLAIMRLDRNSKVKWVRYGHYHHDFDIAPDGKIYALWQDTLDKLPANLELMGAPVLDEGIAVLDADGKLLQRQSILQAISNSKYQAIAFAAGLLPDGETGDRMHNNNVDVLSAEQAAHIQGAKEGDILLSWREMDAIGVLNLENNKIVWASRGSYHRQHDADLLPNGNIMLFDNMGSWQRSGDSRIIEFNPVTEAIVWQYPPVGSKDILWSKIRAEQQVLPNGNVFINESQGSRLIEVTRQHEIVWEYRCNFSYKNDGKHFCSTKSSMPYQPSDLPFLTATPPADGLKLSTLN